MNEDEYKQKLIQEVIEMLNELDANEIGLVLDYIEGRDK